MIFLTMTKLEERIQEGNGRDGDGLFFSSEEYLSDQERTRNMTAPSMERGTARERERG